MHLSWFVVVCAILAQSYGSSGAFAGVHPLVERSRALHLADSPQWKRLLYYSTRWFGPDRSLVEPSEFFLAPSGHTDPQAELEATILALVDPNDSLQLNISPPFSRHAQCQYPARFQFLKAKLTFENIPEMPCERLNSFLSDIDTDRVSLVFSSGFMGNPASMFGHTLFRFHRKGSGSPLLDHAVGFAASPNTKNPLAYAWRGASGGFPGLFGVMPYYAKIQEYNNQESRDLWEYELDLDPGQVSLMLKSVWEVGRYEMPYYYLDVNCASIQLVLLDMTDPTFHFADDILLWVTPTDVTRAFGDYPGLVIATRYWPASLTRYLSRYDTLETDRERDILARLLASHSTASAELRWLHWDGLLPSAKARVLDTALDFIDYTEKLSGETKAVKYASLRNEALLQRSLIPISPEKIPDPPPHHNPAAAHGSVKASLGFLRDRFGTGIGMNWRPALHDILGASSGYSGDLEIRFMDLDFRLLQDSLQLSRLGLLDIVALAPKKPNFTPWSWRLGLFMDEDSTTSDRVLKKYIRYALGLSARPSEKLLLYGLPLIDLGHTAASGQVASGFFGALGFQAGILWTPLQNLRIGSSYIGQRRSGSQVLNDWDLSAAVTLSQDEELRLENTWNTAGYRIFLSYSHYFWHFA